MLNPHIDPTMKAKMLPASLVIRNFVRGEAECDYQKYLLEFVNSSEWFGREHPGVFRAPPSESHGECDAINENYQLDFKLLAGKTALQAKSVLSPQIHKENGVTFFCTSRDKGSIQATRIFAAFREKSLEDLIAIRNSVCKKYGIQNDMRTVLKTLETKKNLLLFFPYKFEFKEPHQHDEAIKSIAEALDYDFKAAFLYRDKYANGYDTFLVSIYTEEFLLFGVCKDGLRLQETVNIQKSETFIRLLNSYGDWWD